MTNEEPKIIEVEFTEENPDVLSLFVSEDVGLTDIPPGTSAEQSFQKREEGLPKEEVEKREKIMSEYTRLLARYCEPHSVKSKIVTKEDIENVLADGKDLVAMCNLPRGKYSGIAALAHSQIENKNPLRFFVFPTGMVIINPVIINHTKMALLKVEACMSKSDNDPIKIPRYNKITVNYQTFVKEEGSDIPVLSGIMTEEYNGGIGHVYQHECQHLNGFNIYDTETNWELAEVVDQNKEAMKAIGYGDGKLIDVPIL